MAISGTDTSHQNMAMNVETLAVSSTSAFTGAMTLTGGAASTTASHGFANWPVVAATSGTDTTPADGTQFVTSIWLPVNKVITGVVYNIGSVGGTDKCYAVLYSAAGAVLANSAIATDGTLVGTAANSQTLAFLTPYTAVGPAMYYVGLSIKGTTARLRTVPAFTSGGIYAGSVSQAHATVAAITVPATFTADKAPIVFLYT